MKREREQPIDNLFQTFLRESGLETPFYEHRLIAGWSGIVGEVVAKATENIYIRNQTLYVQIRSAVIRNEILMKRTELVKTLNEYAGSNVINSISIS